MDEYFEHITAVSPQRNRKVEVRFVGGSYGTFDCSPYVDDPFWACLKDEAFFRKVSLDHGVLTWPNGVDIAPEDVWRNAVRETVA